MVGIGLPGTSSDNQVLSGLVPVPSLVPGLGSGNRLWFGTSSWSGFWRVTHRFSSGMCRAIMMRGSTHSTTQPRRSLIRPTRGFRKWLGMRLQITGVNIWTSSRGGHWGTGFIRSLRNMAAEMGMMFWEGGETAVEYSRLAFCLNSFQLIVQSLQKNAKGQKSLIMPHVFLKSAMKYAAYLCNFMR